MIIRFYWSSKFEDYFEYTYYDYYTKEYKMYDNSFKLEEMLCFECHLDEYVTLNKNLFPDLTLRNSNNNLDLMNYYDIAKLNKDSLISTDEYLHLSNSTEINRSSYNHHLIMINPVSYTHLRAHET